ncbi:MAG: ECF transporter S component [Erysipelotrichaceae bacterium]|nr:ECF transporter S component [Erysipelotrichaceae bacterium]
MKKDAVLKLSMISLMAALSYVAFTYLKINIPLPGGSTAFHLGNTFCVLAALLMGGVPGGLAGAIGMSLADIMDPLYINVAPKTMFLKFMIGLVTGILAHKVFKIRKLEGKDLTLKVVLSAAGGMAFNVIGEPLFGYLYYQFILNMPDKAVNTLMKFNALTTGVNAILAVIIATILYLALYKRFKNSEVMKRLSPENE